MVFQNFKIKKTLQDVIVKNLNKSAYFEYKMGGKKRKTVIAKDLLVPAWGLKHSHGHPVFSTWRIQIEIAHSKIFHICLKYL